MSLKILFALFKQKLLYSCLTCGNWKQANVLCCFYRKSFFRVLDAAGMNQAVRQDVFYCAFWETDQQFWESLVLLHFLKQWRDWAALCLCWWLLAVIFFSNFWCYNPQWFCLRLSGFEKQVFCHYAWCRIFFFYAFFSCLIHVWIKKPLKSVWAEHTALSHSCANGKHSPLQSQ